MKPSPDPTVSHQESQWTDGQARRMSGGRQDTTLLPIVVDLDGTLTPTDTLVESIVLALKHNLLNAIKLPFWLLKGRAAFKALVASQAGFSAEYVPYRSELLDYLRREKEKGRRVILATAAHRTIAERVAAHLGLFDEVLATDGIKNLKGETKLAAIRERIGERFIYAGDSASDLPIWKSASGAILVGVSASVANEVRAVTPIEHELPREAARLKTWLSALRVHQWMKNLLLFVPLLTSFSFLDADKLATVSVAFLAFSFAASATYLVNDLWDLENDRAHPRKCRRPLASARIPIMKGMVVAASALVVALVLASTVSYGFLMTLLLYLVLTGLYSGVLKEFVLIDVITLSLLYTLRILAGSVAVGIKTSSWLLAFSVFIFLSLALLKRCSELVTLEQIGRDATRGRDYRVSDLVVLWPLGIGSALCAVVVFGLFISAEETQLRYASPQLLWLVTVGLTYWISRLWIKAVRGEMHDDPLVFALRNWGSCLTLFVMIVVALVAHVLPFRWP